MNKMLYDPVDAFFSGISSAVARAAFVCIIFILAYSCYGFGYPNFHSGLIASFPLVAFAMIFVWGSKGLLFFLGLFSILTFIYLAWTFVESPNPKLHAVHLFFAALIYFSPLTLDSDLDIWRMVWATSAVVAFYLLLAFVLPYFLSHSRKQNAV